MYDVSEIPHQLHRTIVTLLSELIDGPPADAAYVLNAGDAGLLRSLDRLSAADASARAPGRSSVAAHVDHVRYGLELLNRWSRGENPWADADWTASWQRQTVDDRAWEALRKALRTEATAWIEAAGREREMDDQALAGVLGSVAHLAYHMGAIRQIALAAAGPREPGRSGSL
jgi:hypothetical protein